MVLTESVVVIAVIYFQMAQFTSIFRKVVIQLSHHSHKLLQKCITLSFNTTQVIHFQLNNITGVLSMKFRIKKKYEKIHKNGQRNDERKEKKDCHTSDNIHTLQHTLHIN